MKKSKGANIISIIVILVVCIGLAVFNTHQEKIRIEQQELLKQQEEERQKEEERKKEEESKKEKEYVETYRKNGNSSSNSQNSNFGSKPSGKNKTTNAYQPKTNTGRKNSYKSYDDGYDAVYDDDDYDYDRYNRDPDYADGVDDALDELDW